MGLSVSGQARATNVSQGTLLDALSANTLDNYTVSVTNGRLTITPYAGEVILTANSASGTYSGVTQTVSGFEASGLLGSDSASSMSGYSASGSGKNAGTYASTFSGSNTNANYSNVKTVEGSLTIGKASLTVTGNTTSATYNGSEQTNTYTVSGLVNDETASGVGLSVSGQATGTNVGSYSDSLVAIVTNSTNYAVSVRNGTLTIGQATLPMTGDTVNSATYDGGAHTNTYAVTDVKGSDTVSGLVVQTVSDGGGINADVAAVTVVNVGTYAAIAQGYVRGVSVRFYKTSTNGVMDSIEVVNNNISKLEREIASELMNDDDELWSLITKRIASPSTADE